MALREPKVQAVTDSDPMRVLALDIAQFLDSKRGLDIRVFDVSATLPICTYFILATGTSARQVQAMAEGTLRLLRGRGRQRISVNGMREARWVCIDFGDVVIHLFDPDAREFYGLDHLWGDTPELHFEPAAPADNGDPP